MEKGRKPPHTSRHLQQLLRFHVISIFALTSVLCVIEKVVCEHLTAMLSDSLDPLQLSRQANTGAENAFRFWMSPVGQMLIDLILKVNWLEESRVCRPLDLLMTFFVTTGASERSVLHSQDFALRCPGELMDRPQQRMDDSNCVFFKCSRWSHHWLICRVRFTLRLSGDWGAGSYTILL